MKCVSKKSLVNYISCAKVSSGRRRPSPGTIQINATAGGKRSNSHEITGTESSLTVEQWDKTNKWSVSTSESLPHRSPSTAYVGANGRADVAALARSKEGSPTRVFRFCDCWAERSFLVPALGLCTFRVSANLLLGFSPL